MEIKLELNSKEHQDLIRYCELNKFNPEEIVKKSYLGGFMIEKYGLLNGSEGTKEVEVIKEVIKYVEVPVVEEKEVIKIEYVEVEKPVEKIVEVIKEIPTPPTEVEVIKYVDREVIKEVIIEKDGGDNQLKPKLDALQNTLMKIRQETIEKDKKIKELEETIQNIQRYQENKQAVYLNGSNLGNKLNN
jgi:hypothetical protein